MKSVNMNSVNCFLLVVVLVLVVVCCVKKPTEGFIGGLAKHPCWRERLNASPYKYACCSKEKTNLLGQKTCESYSCGSDLNPNSSKWKKCEGLVGDNYCTKYKQRRESDRYNRKEECKMADEVQRQKEKEQQDYKERCIANAKHPNYYDPPPKNMAYGSGNVHGKKGLKWIDFEDNKPEWASGCTHQYRDTQGGRERGVEYEELLKL